MPPRELARPEIVRLLSRHGVAPMLALPPDRDDDEALAALQPYVAAGLPACAWPLLTDEQGYWPSERNVALFAARVAALLAGAARRQRGIPWLAIDLEPAIGELRRPGWGPAEALARSAWHHLDGDRFAAATHAYAALHKTIAAAGTRTLAIAYPVVSADFAGGGEVMQDLCEAPLGCGWDRVAIMTYGSLVAGYSRRLLSVADARWYGYRALARLGGALGERSGAFVGIVGSGKLGDEAGYDDPAELARDVAAARAAGVAEISLYGLEGVLSRRDPERWLDALTHPGSALPPFRWRGELVHRGVELAARGIEGLRRVARG